MKVLPAVANTVIIQLFITANTNMFSFGFFYGVLCENSEKVLSLLLNLLFENVTWFKTSYVFEGLPENHTSTR